MVEEFAAPEHGRLLAQNGWTQEVNWKLQQGNPKDLKMKCEPHETTG